MKDHPKPYTLRDYRRRVGLPPTLRDATHDLQRAQAQLAHEYLFRLGELRRRISRVDR